MKSRKGQLVCQHLENISRIALEKYPEIIKEFVKGRHGVYALYRKKRLNYVGLATNLRNRLKTHLKDRHAHSWDTFSAYLTIKDSHLHELESLLLRIAMPKDNKQTGKLIRSQDLKPSFKKKIKESQDAETDVILGCARKLINIVKKKQHEKREISLILAPYVKSRFTIRFRYKGKLYRATVRKDGTISYKSKIFNSPSKAAESIRRGGVNGWYAWQYERAPGDWVSLNELRKK